MVPAGGIKSMGWCKEYVTPLLTHWSHVFLVQSYGHGVPSGGPHVAGPAWDPETFTEMAIHNIKAFESEIKNQKEIQHNIWYACKNHM